MMDIAEPRKITADQRRMLEWISENDADLRPIAEAILQEESGDGGKESSSDPEVSAA